MNTTSIHRVAKITKEVRHYPSFRVVRFTATDGDNNDHEFVLYLTDEFKGIVEELPLVVKE